jgi:hypothetical protein
MIGDEHFAVADDKIVPSDLYIFRKGQDVQSYHGKVDKMVRVQPSTVNRKRNVKAMMMPVAGGAKKQGRTMMHAGDEYKEKSEKEVAREYREAKREAAKLLAKRRRIAEKQVMPERRLNARDLESESDDSDDQAGLAIQHRDEREREARLREAQRNKADQRVRDVQRRKAGARKVLSSDDDDDDDDDDND